MKNNSTEDKSAGANRRTFLRMLLGLAVSPFATSTSKFDPLINLNINISNSDSLKRIGRLYLAEHPEEANLRTLRRLINASSGNSHQPIHQRIKLDFDDANTVTVAGWVLSRTEARLCALSICV